MPERIHRDGSGVFYCLIAYDRKEITKPPELERMKIHTLRTIMFVMSQSERKKVCEVVIFRMRGAGLLSQKKTYYC